MMDLAFLVDGRNEVYSRQGGPIHNRVPIGSRGLGVYRNWRTDYANKGSYLGTQFNQASPETHANRERDNWLGVKNRMSGEETRRVANFKPIGNR